MKLGHYTSGEFADMIVDQFDEMLAQSVRQPLVCEAPDHRDRALLPAVSDHRR